MIDVVMSADMIVVSEQMQNWGMTQTNENVAGCWNMILKLKVKIKERL